MCDIPIDQFVTFVETTEMMKKQRYYDIIKHRHPYMTTSEINHAIRDVSLNEDWIRDRLGYSTFIDEEDLVTWALDLWDYERYLRKHTTYSQMDIDMKVLDRLNTLIGA